MVAAKRGAGTTDDRCWSTGSMAGVYEHRCTTRLIHFLHRSFRRCAAPIPSDIVYLICLFTLFTKNMSPKGENKHPAKILPGDHKGEPLTWGSQRAGEVGYFSNERGFSEESSEKITTHFIEILVVETKKFV